MKNSMYCFVHNPEVKSQHLEAVKKGGSMGYERGFMNLEPIDLSNNKNILYLLTDTINRIRRVREADGSMDVRIANSLGFLSSKLLEARKELLFEEKLNKLEEEIKKLGLEIK